MPPTTGEQPAAESKETGEVAAEAAHKEAKGPPTIVPFKESKHIRPKMKIKGGFRPEKLEKKKNTIRTAVSRSAKSEKSVRSGRRLEQ